MITPSEVDPNTAILNPKHLIELEKQFDLAIGLARNSGKWPATVPDGRDGYTLVEIENVADKYHAVGWKIITGQRSERAIIDHPNRQR